MFMYPLHKFCLTAAVPTSMQVSGARLTSLLKPLQRDQGWAKEVWGAGLASTAAASLGFGSWGAGELGLEFRLQGRREGWRCGAGLGVLQEVKRFINMTGGQTQEVWEWG